MHTEHHKLRLNNLTAIVAMAMFLLFAVAQPASVFAQISTTIPFGGKIVVPYPGFFNPTTCPVPNVVVRTNTGAVLAIEPFSGLRLWGNIFLPNINVLGSIFIAPIAPCVAPLTIQSVFKSQYFGTGAVPSLTR